MRHIEEGSIDPSSNMELESHILSDAILKDDEKIEGSVDSSSRIIL